jgi:hypothetical protein
MPIFKLLTVGFLMLYASGCGCTEVGCSDGLAITLQKSSGDWEPGKYIFEVDQDGTKSNCTLDIPNTGKVDCTAGMVLNLKNKTPNSSPEEPIPDVVLTFTAATHVTLTVTRDGTQIAKGDYTPTYVEQEPNGEFCGPTCHAAQTSQIIP